MTAHRCDLCRPDMVRDFGRDVWCPGYRGQVVREALEEDSDEGRRIRAELAREALGDKENA